MNFIGTLKLRAKVGNLGRKLLGLSYPRIIKVLHVLQTRLKKTIFLKILFIDRRFN